MIIEDQKVKTVIRNQKKYYESLGYVVPYYNATIEIKLKDLKLNSNLIVNVMCDDCNNLFSRQYQLLNKASKHLCIDCHRLDVGNKNHIKQSGKLKPHTRGENHPNWNPNKIEFKRYYSKVISCTKRYKHIYELWENNEKRGLAGIAGAYQLDHIIPIKYGFDNNVNPEIIGHINNLRIIPWKENNSKRYKLITI